MRAGAPQGLSLGQASWLLAHSSHQFCHLSRHLTSAPLSFSSFHFSWFNSEKGFILMFYLFGVCIYIHGPTLLAFTWVLGIRTQILKPAASTFPTESSPHFVLNSATFLRAVGFLRQKKAGQRSEASIHFNLLLMISGLGTFPSPYSS